MANEMEKSSRETSQAEAYAQTRHGPDGKVFLDPYFLSEISGEKVKGKRVIDVGCGGGR